MPFAVCLVAGFGLAILGWFAISKSEKNKENCKPDDVSRRLVRARGKKPKNQTRFFCFAGNWDWNIAEEQTQQKTRKLLWTEPKKNERKMQ